MKIEIEIPDEIVASVGSAMIPRTNRPEIKAQYPQPEEVFKDHLQRMISNWVNDQVRLNPPETIKAIYEQYMKLNDQIKSMVEPKIKVHGNEA